MSESKRRHAGRWLVAGVAIVVIIVAWSGVASFATDWLWFASLGQTRTFLTRVWASAIGWGAGAAVAAGMLILNWMILPRRLFGRIRIRLPGKRRRQVTVSARLTRFVIGLVVTLVVLVMASEVKGRWLAFLSALRAPAFGVPDPVFGLDAGFYVFRLPVYRFVVIWLLVLIVVCLVGMILLYLAGGALRGRGAKTHLSALGALFLLGKAADYQLQRYTLLTSSRGLIFGAGHTDIHARLPLAHVLTGLVVLAALLLLVNLFTRQYRLLLIAGLAWVAISLLGQVYPTAVQRFTVQPNELAMERPYINHNIAYTRMAYGLEEVRERDYDVLQTPSADVIDENADLLANVRLWDWRPLRTTYEQLQEIRTYYTFSDVDVDRYVIDGQLREVMLAVRELDSDQLREDARTWVNQRLIYTHGYGLCMSLVSQVSEQGQPEFLVRNVPPETDLEVLSLSRPEVYFGEVTDGYVIVNSEEDEFDYPRGDENVYARYEGTAGVRLGGLFRRLLFASHFDENALLISRAIHADSRILYYRDIGKRVRMLAPILLYDDDPYAVIADGRIVWLYDAYTWTDRFPYSKPTEGVAPAWGLNYIRNSVKVAIDAYSGSTTFYVVDPSDPIIATYQAIFPDLFRPMSEMDEDLRDHWRYPETLFSIQADILAAYHMQDPRVFYNQEDLWETPTEVRDGGEMAMTPYYVTMRLPGEEQTEFLLIRPFVPAGKRNMIAWLYADSDGDDYGQLGLYMFPKEELVYGPKQIEERLEQDPYIRQQLTLWSGRVLRGNMIVIPLDGSLLYVEPLYLQAEAAGGLPELRRVLVAYGDRVAMADTLAESLAQVLRPSSEDRLDPIAFEGDAAALAEAAQEHYQAAEACLQEADWACYGAEMEALERVLEELVAATEGLAD